MSLNATNFEQYLIHGGTNKADYYALLRGSYGIMQFGRDSMRAGMAPVAEAELLAKVKDFTNLPKVTVISSGGVTLSASRLPLPMVTTKATSALQATVRLQAQATFELTPNLNAANGVSAASQFARQLDEAEEAILGSLEGGLATILLGKRTQAGPSSYPYTFNATDDAYNVDIPAGIVRQDEKNLIWGQVYPSLDSIYKRNKVGRKPIALIGSPELGIIQNELKKYDAANSKNENQFTQGLAVYASTAIAVNDGTVGQPAIVAKAFAMPEYTFGVTSWVSPNALNALPGHDIDLASVVLPKSGIRAEVQISKTNPDQSAFTGGGVVDYTEKYTIVVDLIVSTAYNPAPTTQVSPVHLFQFRDNVNQA
jgi:hypothetical protein